MDLYNNIYNDITNYTYNDTKNSTQYSILNTDLNNFKLSNADLDITDESNTISRTTKICNYINYINITSSLYISNYEFVYVTSDIHSDYRKLIQILVTIGIIQIPDDIDIWTDGIYDSRLITDTIWITTNTLFIIVGDLVDGFRPNLSDNDLINDKIGSFEFLLHAFLYNLRLNAKQFNSDVIFTIGNHDHHSVILNDGLVIHNISKNAINFFNNIYTRHVILVPFYDCNPYYKFSLLNNDNSINTIFVHGGLHSDQGELIRGIDEMQHKLNINKFCISSRKFHNELNNMFSYTSISPLWTRYYATDIFSCAKIYKDFAGSLIVVGHCNTSEQEYKHIKQINNDVYKEGCVAVGCNSCLAFVDAGISASFHITSNSDRSVEILCLIPTKTKTNTILKIEIPSGLIYYI